MRKMILKEMIELREIIEIRGMIKRNERNEKIRKDN